MILLQELIGVSWIADRNKGNYVEKFNSSDKQYTLVKIKDIPIWNILSAIDGSFIDSSEELGTINASQAVRWANSKLYRHK